MSPDNFEQTGDDNTVEIGANIELTGWMRGNRNRIVIAASKVPQRVFIQMHGDDNTVTIGGKPILNGLRIEFGNKRYRSGKASLTIGSGFSIASKGRFLLPNPGNTIVIGDGCMFSNEIVLRGGEYPHMIFDSLTGDYLDVSDGIFIGNRVWVGEGAYVNKAVTIPDDCIVGARSVVTKRFTATHAVIAGNPARVVKENVKWIANETKFEPGSPEKASFDAVRAAVAATARTDR